MLHEIMYNSIIILLFILPLREIVCKQNGSISVNNSDHLNKYINRQRSSSLSLSSSPSHQQQRQPKQLSFPLLQQHNLQQQQHNNNHMHFHPTKIAGFISESNRFIPTATASTTKITTTSKIVSQSAPLRQIPTSPQSNLAANKRYEVLNGYGRFRRSSTTLTTNNSVMQAQDDDAAPPMNFLRLYFCGAGYQNCMYNERLNNMHAQHDFLQQIPRMAEITLPTNHIDWKSKQLNLPTDVNILDNSGRREWPLYADEPQYVLIRSDEANPQHLGPDYMDDPFIPQRGRRTKAQVWDDPFIPQRGRRAMQQTWDDPFIPMRGRRTNQQRWDDPFIPQRGRRWNDGGNSYDDPFIPMRGRRANQQLWDDPFIPMRGRRSGQNTILWDDPFIPQRGRRTQSKQSERDRRSKQQAWDDPFIPQRGRRYDQEANYWDDPFIPQRGRRSIELSQLLSSSIDKSPTELTKVSQMDFSKMQRKRGLIAPNGAFNTLYTPTEEFIVKLNSLYSSKNLKNLNALKTTNSLLKQNQNKLLLHGMMSRVQKQRQKQQSPLLTNQLIRGANERSSIKSSRNSCCDYGKYSVTMTNRQQQQHHQPQFNELQNQRLQYHHGKQKKTFGIPNRLATNNNNNEMSVDDNEYSEEYYLEPSSSSARQGNEYAMQSNNNNNISKMSSLNNLSQENRDSVYLARGSRTPFAF